MVALNASPVGKTQQIKWIGGNLKETKDIREIGIEEGSFVTVLNNIGDSVIVAINNLRYGISGDLACRIKVG